MLCLMCVKPRLLNHAKQNRNIAYNFQTNNGQTQAFVLILLVTNRSFFKINGGAGLNDKRSFCF